MINEKDTIEKSFLYYVLELYKTAQGTVPYITNNNAKRKLIKAISDFTKMYKKYGSKIEKADQTK